jgi:hypothetical protein
VRTTVELPAELLRAAKARAAARGETLRQFLARAVAHELGNMAAPATGTRVKLPLVGSRQTGSVDITNDRIEEVLAAEDAENASIR